MKALFILGRKTNIFILRRVLSQGYEQEINLRQSALGHQRAETRDQRPVPPLYSGKLYCVYLYIGNLYNVSV